MAEKAAEKAYRLGKKYEKTYNPKVIEAYLGEPVA